MSIEITPANILIQTPSASFTRPSDTTQYASGDLVANSVTAGSVVAMQFPVAAQNGLGKVRRAKIAKSNTSVTTAQFRLHLYSAAPTAANGDNAAWSTNGVANYLGSLSLGAAMGRAFTDGASDVATPDAGVEVNFNLSPKSSATIYGLLEARGTYTPASAEVFTVTLEIDQI